MSERADFGNALEELWNRGYDTETIEVVDDYYGDSTPPEGDPIEKADKIESRLHRIFPEEYLEKRYDNEALNHIYSITKITEDDSIFIVPEVRYKETEFPESVDLGEIFLDHSILYNTLNRTNILVEPGEDFNPEEVYEVPWYKPLDLIDNVLTLNKEEDLNIDVKFPGDVYYRAKLQSGKTKHKEYEAFGYLETVGERFKISNVEEIESKDVPVNDLAVAKGILNENENPLLMTLDRNFKDLTEFEDIKAMPPDLAQLTLKASYENFIE